MSNPKEVIHEQPINLPFFISWANESSIPGIHDITVFSPTASEYEQLTNLPVRWALQRALQRPVLAGEKLFFYNQYSNSENAKESTYPFFLWPLANKIVCNDTAALIRKIYDYGEFDLEEIVEKRPLSWLSKLLSASGLHGNRASTGGKNSEILPVKKLFGHIFDLLNFFKKLQIFWIEDKKNVYIRAGIEIEKEQFEEGKLNLHALVNGKSVKKILITENPDELYQKIDDILEKGQFCIFIIDMFFELKDNFGNETIKIFGDNVIKRIRTYRKGAEKLQDLIIVFTHGSSPFIISRSKALGADLVIFKEQTAAKGHHSGNDELHLIDPQFLLVWSIYWPLSVLHHICKQMQQLVKIQRDEDLIALLTKIDREIGLLCPERVFTFWENWIESTKKTLKNWIVILSKPGAKLDNYHAFVEEFSSLIKQVIG